MIQETYRIWCDTDSKWETITQNKGVAVPTVCPINGGHTIIADRTSLIRTNLNPLLGVDQSGASPGDVLVCYGADDWRVEAPTGVGDSFSIDLGGNNEFKSLGRDTSNQIIKDFVYCGAVKTISKVQAIVDRSALASVKVEIYDYTNAQSICSATTTVAGKLILDLGTISNLPTSDAIFEVRVSTGGGGNNDSARLYNVNILFQ